MVGGPGVGGIQIICCGKSTGGGVSVDEQKSTGNTSNSISPPPPCRNLITEIHTSMAQLGTAVVLTEQEVRGVFNWIMVPVSHQLSSQEHLVNTPRALSCSRRLLG